MTLHSAPDSIEIVPIGRVEAYGRNARRHSPEQIAKIASSLVEYGWTQPLLVTDRNELVAGHGRLAAARQLGLEAVPVIRLAHLTPEQARAYRIADNKLALDSEWDEALLADELRGLGDGGFDLNLTGFDDRELAKMMASVETTLDEAEPAAAADEPEEAPADVEAEGDSPAVTLSDRFGIPPFSALNARGGWWQERKRAWLALGMRSELGRGDVPPGGGGGIYGYRGPSDMYAGDKAAPGGSKMPAADFAKSGARGDGRGRAVA